MRIATCFVLVLGVLIGFSLSTLTAGYADKLLGTWEGKQEGYSGDRYEQLGFRITFLNAEGCAAIGTKQWRNSSGEWSAPESVQAILQKNDTFSAVDHDGYMNGKLVSKNKLKFVYMEAVGGDFLDDSVSLLVTLKRLKSCN